MKPAHDDPDVILVARAIAEHGVGRDWNDFLPVNAHDIDQGDMIEYARAAVAALRAKANPRFNRDFALVRENGSVVMESHDAASLNVIRIELIEQGIVTRIVASDLGRSA